MGAKQWLSGDHAPNFIVRASNSPRFTFYSVAGRYIVLSFFGTGSNPAAQEALKHVASKNAFFDDTNAAFFGVSIDPADEASGALPSARGIRFFWDFDKRISTEYGALARDGTYYPFTLVLDPMLRVMAKIPMLDVASHNQMFDTVLAALPSLDRHAGVPMHAPVLVLPRVFEPEFCKELIKLYDHHGGQQSGFMREIDGKTVGVLDNTFKRRMDFSFDGQPELEGLRNAIRTRVSRSLIPAIHKAFQFHATRMERYIVACYDSESEGFFRPHRDNTTKGTAHRRFACTINLNADEYDGGTLRFPEFGHQSYRAPTGGAVVFSCSLLHEALPVTKGTRYAFLPFLYDEAAAKIREQNMHSLTGQMVDRNKGEDEGAIVAALSSEYEEASPE